MSAIEEIEAWGRFGSGLTRRCSEPSTLEPGNDCPSKLPQSAGSVVLCLVRRQRERILIAKAEAGQS